MRQLLLVAVLVSGCATMSPARRAALEQDAQPAVDALESADFDVAITRANESLGRDEKNARAAAVLAISLFRKALHDAVTDAVTFASSVAVSSLGRGSFFNRDYLDFALTRLDGRLADVDVALAKAETDPGFTLDLCLACWQVDWNRSGEVDRRDEKLLQIELDERGEELPEDDVRRRPTFHFDHADVLWLRALVMFGRSVTAFAQGWDPDINTLMRSKGSLSVKVRDAKALEASRGHLLVGLGHARRCREAVLAETDDEREWLPNPTQRSHAMPLSVDTALFETWAGVLDDVEALVTGREGLSVTELAQLGKHQWPTPPTGFLDLSRFYRPVPFVLDGEEASRSPLADDAATAERFLSKSLGDGFRPAMPKSRLPGRLTRMRDEMERGEESFEKKLRYLFWLN